MPLVVRFLRWFICLLECGSCHFVPCILSFFVCLFVVGALVFLSLSSSLCVDVSKKINVMANEIVEFGGFSVFFLP